MQVYHCNLPPQEFALLQQKPETGLIYLGKQYLNQLCEQDYICFHQPLEQQHMIVKVESADNNDAAAAADSCLQQFYTKPAEIIVREMQAADYERKGYIHYQSWNETYTGLIDQRYLDSRSLEKCIAVAKQYPDHTLVLELDHTIIGFASFSFCEDEDSEHCGEINAIYLLRQYHHMGLGVILMDACLDRMRICSKIVLWVLVSNEATIRFYETYGFQKDGKEKNLTLANVYSLHVCRMYLAIT